LISAENNSGLRTGKETTLSANIESPPDHSERSSLLRLANKVANAISRPPPSLLSQAQE
jgi:hypothetical protein